MSRKTVKKDYWNMTTEELAEATAEFDGEFDESQFKPLTASERAWWKRVQSELRARKNGTALIAVRLDKRLLRKCESLARKKRISRDALIARGIQSVLAAQSDTNQGRNTDG